MKPEDSTSLPAVGGVSVIKAGRVRLSVSLTLSAAAGRSM